MFIHIFIILRDGITLKKSFKRKSIKKLLTITLGFIFLFSTGFIIGTQAFNGKASANNTKYLQGTPTVQPPKSADENNTDKLTDKPKEDQSVDNPKAEGKPENKNEDKTEDESKPKKEVFLTFDDGPTTKVTPRILEILDEYDVKATFFVIGQNAEKNPELIKEEKAKGHAIANHTYSHDYNYIYNNPDNFLKDLEKGNETLATILGGHSSKLIRFPGGSFGSKRAPYREVVKAAGYTYVDWNALNGDAEALNVPVATLIQNIKETTGSKNHVVVLMHDAATKGTTADALPQIIEYYKSQGYEFKTLEEE